MRTSLRQLFHYTSRARLGKILQSRAIMPDLTAHDPILHGKAPLVWVSAITPWDPVCRATLELDPMGWPHLIPGKVPGAPYCAARILVTGNVAKPWAALLTDNGADEFAIFKLAQTGYDSGSDPEQWYVCQGPISVCFWQDVQIWNGMLWETFDNSGDLWSMGDLDAYTTLHGYKNEAN